MQLDALTRFALTALLASAASAQDVVQDFEGGNSDLWGPAPFTANLTSPTAGNPGFGLITSLQTIGAATAPILRPGVFGSPTPWAGDWRADGVAEFRFDRAVTSASGPDTADVHVLIVNDNGTLTDTLDDTIAYFSTGDTFSTAPVPYATISTPIDTASLTLPPGWGIVARANSPLFGLTDDQIWNGLVIDVTYVALALACPDDTQCSVFDGTYALSLDNFVLSKPPPGPPLFCTPASPNSSGSGVTLGSSDFSGPGLVHLEAEGGPSGQFGYVLVSAGFNDPGLPVSQGVLCLATPQGRYNGVGGTSSIGQFDAAGVLQNISGTSSVGSGFDVPAALPNPPGGVIGPGSTYHFQLWYRDGPQSNFSDGLSVTFP